MPSRSSASDPAPESFLQSQKITVSLFQSDNEKLTAVQMALARRGRRVTASHVVRLALRSLPVNKAGAITEEAAEKLLALLDGMKAEDGRLLRHQ